MDAVNKIGFYFQLYAHSTHSDNTIQREGQYSNMFEPKGTNIGHILRSESG